MQSAAQRRLFAIQKTPAKVPGRQYRFTEYDLARNEPTGHSFEVIARGEVEAAQRAAEYAVWQGRQPEIGSANNVYPDGRSGGRVWFIHLG